MASLTTYLMPMRPEDLLLPTPSGVCCKAGGFHIDPTRPVDKALITHGHSDHARAGHGAVLATQETLDIMRLRYGENFAGTTQAVRYGETHQARRRDGDLSSGRACAGFGADRVERKGLRIVASGDYKDGPDPTCAPFELVPCDVFITEATFGLPVFRHRDAEGEIAKLLHSVELFPGARASGRRLFARQGAARDRADARAPATTSRSTCMARWRRSRAITRARHRSRRDRARARREEGRARRHHHHRAALRDRRFVVAALPRSGRRRSRRAGCGCAPARARAASSCRW